MEKPIIKAIEKWVKDFEGARLIRKVGIGAEVFEHSTEGSAYYIFKTILAVEKRNKALKGR